MTRKERGMMFAVYMLIKQCTMQETAEYFNFTKSTVYQDIKLLRNSKIIKTQDLCRELEELFKKNKAYHPK